MSIASQGNRTIALLSDRTLVAFYEENGRTIRDAMESDVITFDSNNCSTCAMMTFDLKIIYYVCPFSDGRNIKRYDITTYVQNLCRKCKVELNTIPKLTVRNYSMDLIWDRFYIVVYLLAKFPENIKLYKFHTQVDIFSEGKGHLVVRTIDNQLWLFDNNRRIPLSGNCNWISGEYDGLPLIELFDSKIQNRQNVASIKKNIVYTQMCDSFTRG